MARPSLENHRRKKRYSAFAVAWVWLSFLTAILLAIGVLVALRAGQTRQQLLQNDIDESLEMAVSLYRDDLNNAKFLASTLIEQDSFRARIKASDPNLLRVLDTASPLEHDFFVGVWDNQKRLLAQNRSGDSYAFNPQALDNDLQKGLLGQEINRIELDPSGLARTIFITPVRDPGARETIGVLVVCFYLSNSFTNYIKLDDSEQILVVSNGQYVLAQLDGPDGLPLLGKPAPEALINAEKQRSQSLPFNIDTRQGNFEFTFVPLSSTLDSPSLLGIGTPVLTPLDGMIGFLDDYGSLFLLVFAVLGIVGLVYSRRLNSSIRELRTGMQRLSCGDLSTPTKIERADEIGDLAGELERVRERFSMELEAVKSERLKYAQTIEAMRVAVITTDSFQFIRSLNPAAKVLLKESNSQIIGQPWSSLFAGDGNLGGDAFGWNLESAAMNKSSAPGVSLSSRLSLCKYPLVKVDVVSSPIMLANNIEGFVHILYDASSREQVERSKDEFLLNASHELRSPLAKLKVANELLAEVYEEKNWEQMGGLLANMQRSLTRFQVFVENLIDIGSVQAGRFHVRPRSVDYNKIVADALSGFQPAGSLKSQALELHSTIPSPCMVMADPQRLVQVMFNLLSNAVKYGGEENPVRVSVFSENGSVFTQVTDYGLGIPAEEIPLIFERYYRGKRVESEGIGLGLGLAITREIIEQHGGEITVTSDQEHGTCFSFRLPMVH